MPTFVHTKTYDDNTVLTEAQLDNSFDQLVTLLNTTKLDNSNIQTGGIATANYADVSVTKAKLGTVGQQVSSAAPAIGAYTNATTSYTDITNLSATITTVGRPVILFIQADTDATGIGSFDIFANSAVTNIGGHVKLIRDSTDIAIHSYQMSQPTASTTFILSVPVSLAFLDAPSAGTYTYKLQAKAIATSTTIRVARVKLVAYEL